MDVRKLLKECLEEESIDFLEVVYEDSENNGELLTPEFVKELKKFKKECEKRKNKYKNDLYNICRKDDVLINDIEDSLNSYLEAIESENVFYTRSYYRLRIKRWC